MKRVGLVVAVLMLAALAGCVVASPGTSVSPLAAPETPIGAGEAPAGIAEVPPLDTPEAFLGWLAVGGAPLIGALIALLARKSPWFQQLSSAGKWWVSFGCGTGLPVLAGLLLMYVPAAFWDAIRPLWVLVMSAALGYLGKEAAYVGWVKPVETKPGEAQNGRAD